MAEEISNSGSDPAVSESDAASAGPYAVGYGRPPVHTRFKPGQSGNPRGRPKGHRNAKTIVAKVLDEPVIIREGEKTRRVSNFEAMIQANTLKAIKGDTRALAQMISLLTRTGQLAEAELDPGTAELGDEDEAIISEFLRRSETSQ